MPSLSERFQLLAHQPLQDTFADDVRAGLTAEPKTLMCRYFYDQLGSQLFEEICEQPEYYLTRAETEILQQHGDSIAHQMGEEPILVELGSGSGLKTRILLSALLAKFGQLTYLPVDISTTMLEDSAKQLLKDFPNLSVSGISGEYRFGLQQLKKMSSQSKLILWLGSNVGNMNRDEAGQFLSEIGSLMLNNDRLLMGVDRLKDAQVLHDAYNDAAGVTARFNLNILGRLQRELHSDLDLSKFQHCAKFDSQEGRIEMSLKSLCEQTIQLKDLDLTVKLAANEQIVTEHCHKYSDSQIKALAQASGLEICNWWSDSQRRFSLVMFRASTPGV
jgi:L-histidine N-alpha-methyltransferase